ncbi:trehalase family glycosidase [Streptomyces sp. NBC_01306]|uniref:MGH1-like glycoside hydrolase domain-containing protein n=1 Tax=Streptomyces sp. NBC_01306 TaxID=2903819 RepID=UPI002256D1AD|nr:trehalase family glycosidase [Streptomyces sp. NBC_01306]MCX4729094.1 trehalase family glycosidase [Streptomyces sp. NBC_01306]
MIHLSRRQFAASSLVPLGAALLPAAPAHAQETAPQETAPEASHHGSGDSFRDGLSDVLDLHGLPEAAEPPGDNPLNVFADLGAWHAYGLPSAADHAYFGGFSGPLYVAEEYPWYLSRAFSRFGLVDERSARAVDLSGDRAPRLEARPGVLTQAYVTDGLCVTVELRYATNRSALVRATVQNRGNSVRELRAHWTGSLLRHTSEPVRSAPRLQATDDGVAVRFAEVRSFKDFLTTAQTRFEVAHAGSVRTTVHGDEYRTTAHRPTRLAPGATATFTWTESYTFTDAERRTNHPAVREALAHPDRVADRADRRWQRYLTRSFDGVAPDRCRTAAKAVQTLVTNWRSPAGALRKDGITPSLTNTSFAGGFWAWDSWKEAAATAIFDPQLAVSTIESMFDHQIQADSPDRPQDAGMVPDALFYNDIRQGGLNWNERNSKPPLAAWAVWQVYERGGGRAFLHRMYPKLRSYHAWWYRDRDHDHNGLAEYGATVDPANDSTAQRRLAAAWESGMDNAPRFDDTQVRTNTDRAGRTVGYSLAQQSVDLNCFLYAEKRFLARMATELGWPDEAKDLNHEADALRDRIRAHTYDPATGYFYDCGPDSSGPLTAAGKGIEGAVPLWTGVASAREAAGARAALTDPAQFGTFMPLPTVARNNPKFDPTGYWRGLVWLDQAYFAIRGLSDYGYDRDARAIGEQLLQHADGLLGDGPIHENYHPLTGAGKNSANFSWSAAVVLEMLRKHPSAAPLPRLRDGGQRA